jgi:glucan phosphoethanolaminetransferase (alkaline phosphatase superfamily)
MSVTAPSTARRRLPILLGAHLLVSAAAAVAFASQSGAGPRVVVTHVLLVAEWDLALLALVSALRLPRQAFRVLLALTCTAQVYLYALNLVSNESWDRNMTAHLVSAFAPTVWSGKEPFPVGPIGISAFFGGTLLVVAAAFAWWGRAIDEAVGGWLVRLRGIAVAVTAVAMIALFTTTLRAGVAGRDNLYWKNELVSSFFRPEGFAFEPTARRLFVAHRDAELQAAYPRSVPGAHRTNVVLVIVDSLRADRMHVYGYARDTTPFLSQMVASGRMKKVADAFSTCSESFCGITSTLSGREFQDISAETFNLQDVLKDEGYRTWFLLSGNHRAWNGLPRFYHLSGGELFDGSQTTRYTMDDDRLVFEGLERVPPASPGHPAFFYIHLMSTHYLGVQFPESHVFTRPDDRVSPGLEPYKILQKLNKPDRYDDKVRQADGVIHRLFDALDAKHYLDNAMVVVTGDHGEGLGERHWAHGWNLYDEDIRIPLLLYDAPAATYPDLTFGVQVDIAPTILDRLGLPIPASWEGQSLLHPAKQRYTHHQTYFVPNRFAVLDRDGGALYKYIATPRYGKEELYDLRTDAREQHDLAADLPALTARLRGQLVTDNTNHP